MIPLTIWMNVPSHHQSGLFRALVATREVDLQIIFSRRLTEERKKIGWQGDLDGFPSQFLHGLWPHIEATRLAYTQRQRIHIVNGVWAEKPFTAALLALRLSGSIYAIYSEAQTSSLADSYMKHLLKNTLGRWIIYGAAGMLTISRRAADYYAQFGLREERAYPFGYFQSRSAIARNTYDCSRDKIEVIYVGRLITLKGLDLLIEAMRPLFDSYPALKLSLVGDGECRKALEQQSSDLRDRIFFEGVLHANQVCARIAQADVIVLPSRYDGWGAVVNEAFSVGTPVIISDHCGAAELVKGGQNGYVFRSDDIADLRATLKAFLDQRAHWTDFREAAAYTGNLISAENVAPYLLDCVRHMSGLIENKPVPPWIASH